MQSAAGDICVGRTARMAAIKLNARAELTQGLSKVEYQAAKVNPHLSFLILVPSWLKKMEATSYSWCLASALNNLSGAISPGEDCQ